MSYLYKQGRFYIPSAPKTKKVRNLKANAGATIVIDDEDVEHGLMIECESQILDGARAEPFKKYMREVKRWKNDETTVVIELVPRRRVSWFLK